MSLWDDKEVVSSGNFVKFENPGDTVTGRITAMRKQVFESTGNVAAVLELTKDDGTDVTLTAGQVQLKNKLAEIRPEVGDKITVTFTQSERRDGGKTLKHFDVTVDRGAGAPAAASPPPFVPTETAAPAAAVAQPAANGLDPAALQAAMAMLAQQQSS